MAEANEPEPWAVREPLPPSAHLRLLGAFDLVIGKGSVLLGAGAQRLLALLALTGTWITRVRVAGTLWPDRPEQRAAANLRTTLWRMPVGARDVIVTSGNRLQLSPVVSCDIEALDRVVRAAIGGGGAERAGSGLDGAGLNGVSLLRLELLPDWYDDWVLAERERLLQLRMHALESLCRSLAAAGRHAEAVDAGTAAVAVEPLWESAQRALAEAYLAEGNHGGALQRFLEYEALLLAELGIGPTDEFRRLVGR